MIDDALCPWCGNEQINPASTCPLSLRCPTCLAAPGRRCRRPSGHDCDIHEPRWDAAAEQDRQRAVATNDVAQRQPDPPHRGTQQTLF